MLKAKVSEIIGRDLLDIKKSLNTSAQRAEVRRLALDIENMKVEFVKPIDDKLQKLYDEFNKRKKEEKKVRLGCPRSCNFLCVTHVRLYTIVHYV